MTDSLDTINQGSRGFVGDGKGQSQNIIDEQKDNYGTTIDKDVGANMSGETTASGLSERLGGSETTAGSTNPVDRKVEATTAKIGGNEDEHDLAAAKQP